MWDTHLAARCLIALDRPGEALDLLGQAADSFERLLDSCGEDVNWLDTCAAHCETLAEALRRLGRAEEEDIAVRGQSIRNRIAELEKPAD